MSKIQIPALVAIMAGEEIIASSLKQNYKKEIKEIENVLKDFAKFVTSAQKTIKGLKLDEDTLEKEYTEIKDLASLVKKHGSLVSDVLTTFSKEIKSQTSVKERLKRGARSGRIRAPKGI